MFEMGAVRNRWDRFGGPYLMFSALQCKLEKGRSDSAVKGPAVFRPLGQLYSKNCSKNLILLLWPSCANRFEPKSTCVACRGSGVRVSLAPFLKDPASGWVFLCLELVPGREVYKLVSPSLKAFLQFTHLSCRPKEPSWAALGMCAINLGSCRGLVLRDRQSP